MKYSWECKVDSKTHIGNTISTVVGNKEYTLTSNEKGMLSSIKIITKVDDPENFYSQIEKGDGKAVAKITIEADYTIFNDLKSDFQYIESALSFLGNLRRIYWEEPKQEWIPETKEEESRLKVSAVSFRREGYPDDPRRLTKRAFESIIRTKNKFDCLTTLKAFYREGDRFFKGFQYINAFYNFYFILEDLYGGGKTKNKQIEENFRSSAELREIINWVMKKHIDAHKKHSKNISESLKERNLKNTADDIMKLLVRTRGRVHHYTSKSTLRQATPLAQRDFESMAFLTMGIALMSILRQIVKINQQYKQQNST